MKKLFSFITVAAVAFFISCGFPKRKADINSDGGLSLLLQAPMQDIIWLNAQPGDTLVNSAIKRTEATINSSNATFIELFIQELYKNGNGSDIHFNGLKANPSASECSQYLIKKTEETTEELKQIILKRMDLMGIEGATANIIGNDGRIMIELPGVITNPGLHELLLARGNFEFWETYDNKEIYPVLEKVNTQLYEISYTGKKKPALDTTTIPLDSSMSLDEQLASIKQGTVNRISPEELAKLENPLFVVFAPSITYDGGGNAYLTDGPVIGYASIADTARVNGYLLTPEIKSILPPKLKFAWSFKPADSQGNTIQLVALRAKNINGGPALNGKFIEDIRKIEGEDGVPQISIKMHPAAAVIWQNVTRDNIGKSIAMVLDGKVYSFPTVQSEIKGGISAVTGNFTQEEATGIANVLNSGTLPVRVVLLEEKLIPPLEK